ncbi:MAG: WD40 repeat domain-containing protein [Gemmataceae bacterium]
MSHLQRRAAAVFLSLLFASHASAQGVFDLPFGFHRGREVFPEQVAYLNGPNQGKQANLKDLVETAVYRCTVVWANDPDDAAFKLAEAFDGMSHFKRSPMFLVCCFANQEKVAAKAAKLNHVVALRATNLTPNYWTAHKVDLKIKVMVHLVERKRITEKIDLQAGDLTEARTAELRKQIEAFGSALTAEESSGLITKFHTHNGGSRQLVFSPDGKFLYTFGAERDTGDNLRLAKWEVPSGKQIASIAVAYGGAYGLSITRDGSTLATTSHDGMVHFWDTDELMRGERIKTPTSAFCGKLSPDDKLIAVGNHDKTVRIYDVATRKEKAALKGHDDRVMCLDFSADSKYLVSGGEDGKLVVWDVAHSKAIANWVGHDGPLERVAFSPDGKTIASTGRDGKFGGTSKARLWDSATGKAKLEIEALDAIRPRLVLFLDGGKTLAVAGDAPTIRLIRTDTGKAVRSIEGQVSVILSLGVSADGSAPRVRHVEWLHVPLAYQPTAIGMEHRVASCISGRCRLGAATHRGCLRSVRAEKKRSSSESRPPFFLDFSVYLKGLKIALDFDIFRVGLGLQAFQPRVIAPPRLDSLSGGERWGPARRNRCEFDRTSDTLRMGMRTFANVAWTPHGTWGIGIADQGRVGTSSMGEPLALPSEHVKEQLSWPGIPGARGPLFCSSSAYALSHPAAWDAAIGTTETA